MIDLNSGLCEHLRLFDHMLHNVSNLAASMCENQIMMMDSHYRKFKFSRETMEAFGPDELEVIALY